MTSAFSSSALALTNSSMPPWPFSSWPSMRTLTPDGAVGAERREGAGVHDDARLVVGGAAAVQAAGAFRRLEGRARPGLVRRPPAARRSARTAGRWARRAAPAAPRTPPAARARCRRCAPRAGRPSSAAPPRRRRPASPAPRGSPRRPPTAGARGARGRRAAGLGIGRLGDTVVRVRRPQGASAVFRIASGRHSRGACVEPAGADHTAISVWPGRTRAAAPRIRRPGRRW